MTAGAWDDVALMAVDIGNTRIKLACYRAEDLAAAIPTPKASADNSKFDEDTHRILSELSAQRCRWIVSSVNRPSASLLERFVEEHRKGDTFELLTADDVPLEIDVEQPRRVGMDRLMACVAADHLRQPKHPAIVVAIGTAITVNLLTAEGAFAGGAILPGIYMAAEALSRKTDLLPVVSCSLADDPPAACGKNTEEAIASGLYWGTAGAIRELIDQIGQGQVPPGNLFFTGGDGAQFAAAIDPAAVYRADMVLLGVALTARRSK